MEKFKYEIGKINWKIEKLTKQRFVVKILITLRDIVVFIGQLKR